ncbi:Rx [Theobroma cacao]|nr:Rx [Theobroma cacao]
MSFFDALSAIGEVVVSKFFDFLIDKLVSSDLLQFATEKKIHEGMEKLKKELLEIREVLDDAEERQLRDKSVKIWLFHLQILAYDVDDVLDELATEISRRNLMMERRGSSNMYNHEMMDIGWKLQRLVPAIGANKLRLAPAIGANKLTAVPSQKGESFLLRINGASITDKIAKDCLKHLSSSY